MAAKPVKRKRPRKARGAKSVKRKSPRKAVGAKTVKRKSPRKALGAKAAKRKSPGKAFTSKPRKRTSARAALAADPVIQELKALIADRKIIFDSDKQRKELLGLNTGTKVTRKLQSLVIEMSNLAGEQIRISSLVREGAGSHHNSGRAADIGNEEIAGTLLPRVATDAQVAALEIDEIIFDAAVAGETDRNKWNYDLGRKHDYDSTTLGQHGNHIHFAVKAG